jgi:hypothetical protein
MRKRSGGMPGWFWPALTISGVLVVVSGLAVFRREHPEASSN